MGIGIVGDVVGVVGDVVSIVEDVVVVGRVGDVGGVGRGSFEIGGEGRKHCGHKAIPPKIKTAENHLN